MGRGDLGAVCLANMMESPQALLVPGQGNGLAERCELGVSFQVAAE